MKHFVYVHFIYSIYIYNIYVNRKVYILAHFNERLIVYSYTLYDIYKRCRQSEILKEKKNKKKKKKKKRSNCVQIVLVFPRDISLCVPLVLGPQ